MSHATDFDLTGRLLLDRFRVRQRLDRGGMGSVWLADDIRFGLPAVIKIPTVSLLDEEGFRDRFELEVKSLTRLVHPHIVRVHDFGVVDDVPFMAMQFLGGGSLKQRFGDKRQQNPEVVLRWLKPIADALDYMHSKEMLHRDVKPANILFDDADHAHLADFGIAKSLASTDTGLTRTGASPGTPQYVPPEAFDGVELDRSADQYSLALIVYEALTGIQAHGGTSLNEVLGKIMKPLKPLIEIVPKLSPTVNGVVMRALHRDPSKRFASCGIFAQAFERALRAPAGSEEEETVSGIVGDGTQAQTEFLRRKTTAGASSKTSAAPQPGRKGTVVAFVVLVVVGAGAVGAWKYWDELQRIFSLLNAHPPGPQPPPEKPPSPVDTTPPTLLNSVLNGGNVPHRCEEKVVACTLTFSEPVWVSSGPLRSDDVVLADSKSVELSLPTVDYPDPQDEPLKFTATDAYDNKATVIVHVALYSGVKHFAAIKSHCPSAAAGWSGESVAKRSELAMEFERHSKDFEAEAAKDTLLLPDERTQLLSDAEWIAQRKTMAEFLKSQRKVRIALDSPKAGAATNQAAVNVKGKIDPDDVASIKLWFEGTPPRAFNVKPGGLVDETLELPKRSDGKIADADYVLNIANEAGEVIDKVHVLVDRTLPTATTVQVRGTPPFRVEAKTFELELAFSEPVDVFLAEKHEKVVSIGTKAITVRLDLPESRSADSEPKIVKLTASDAATNEIEVSVPIEIFSAKARVERYGRQLPEAKDGSIDFIQARSTDLDTWQQSVLADALLTKDEQRALQESAKSVKTELERLADLARQEKQQRDEEERKRREQAAQPSGPVTQEFPGFDSIDTPNALGYPRAIRHVATGIELIAVDLDEHSKPTLYVSKELVTEQEYDGESTKTTPQVKVNASDLVTVWCVSGRGRGLGIPTDEEWSRMSASADRRVSDPPRPVGELLDGQRNGKRGDIFWPTRTRDGHRDSWKSSDSSKSLGFRVVFRVP